MLKDKATLVRADAASTVNKWAEAIGAGPIITLISLMILEPNPEGRSEGLGWILKNASAIPDADTSEMIKPLVSCLTDKSKDIRTKAEEVISLVMPVAGHSAFIGSTKDFPQAIQ